MLLRRPALLVLVAGLVAARLAWHPGMAICGQTTMSGCLVDAVLAHEAEHARRRDPLRHLAARAAAEVLFWLPLVDWWSRGRLEDAELAADRAAIRQVGRPPLARALRATATPAEAAVGIRFDGAGPARVAQLLGDQPPRRRPPLAACALSLLGLVVAVSLAMCVGQGLIAAVTG